jgi:hypothetical protein
LSQVGSSIWEFFSILGEFWKKSVSFFISWVYFGVVGGTDLLVVCICGRGLLLNRDLNLKFLGL